MPYSDSLKPEHVANLKTLSAFLKTRVPPPEFGMRYFSSTTNFESDEIQDLWYKISAVNGVAYTFTKQPEFYAKCGTVACAVGHGPLAGIPAREFEGWTDYAERVFGVRFFYEEFDWLFGGIWSDVDDTAKGAAARIDWYLESGVPDNSSDQMHGRAPLCYAVETV